MYVTHQCESAIFRYFSLDAGLKFHLGLLPIRVREIWISGFAGIFLPEYFPSNDRCLRAPCTRGLCPSCARECHAAELHLKQKTEASLSGAFVVAAIFVCEDTSRTGGVVEIL